MKIIKKLFTSLIAFALITFLSKTVASDMSFDSPSPSKITKETIEEEDFRIGQNLEQCADDLQGIGDTKDKKLIQSMRARATELKAPYILRQLKENRKNAPKRDRGEVVSPSIKMLPSGKNR